MEDVVEEIWLQLWISLTASANYRCLPSEALEKPGHELLRRWSGHIVRFRPIWLSRLFSELHLNTSYIAERSSDLCQGFLFKVQSTAGFLCTAKLCTLYAHACGRHANEPARSNLMTLSLSDFLPATSLGYSTFQVPSNSDETNPHTLVQG